MEINEKLEVFFGAAIGAANSQSESMLDEQKNIYQSLRSGETGRP